MSANNGRVDPFALGEDAGLRRTYSKTAGELASMLETFDRRVRGSNWRSLAFDVPELDEVIDTLWPGTLTMVLARPSNRKSSTLKHMARVECQRLMVDGDGRVVVFVTLEESEEAVTLAVTGAAFTVRDIARGDVTSDEVARHSDAAAHWPFLVVGHSLTELSRARLGGRPAPRLTAEQVFREIEQASLDEHGKPAAVFVDYVQRAATEGREGSSDERASRVANAVTRFAEMAKRLDVPIVLAAQAGRQVDGRAIPAPSIGDGQHSSQLEQDADTVIGLWYPAKTEVESRRALKAQLNGEPMVIGNVAIPYAQLMQPETMTIWLRKQRHGVPAGQWAVKVDPSTGVLASWPKYHVTGGGR